MAEDKQERWKSGRDFSAAKLALKMFKGLQNGEHTVQVWL